MHYLSYSLWFEFAPPPLTTTPCSAFFHHIWISLSGLVGVRLCSRHRRCPCKTVCSAKRSVRRLFFVRDRAVASPFAELATLGRRSGPVPQIWAPGPRSLCRKAPPRERRARSASGASSAGCAHRKSSLRAIPAQCAARCPFRVLPGVGAESTPTPHLATKLAKMTPTGPSPAGLLYRVGISFRLRVHPWPCRSPVSSRQRPVTR